MAPTSDQPTRHVYWVDTAALPAVKADLEERGFRLATARLTPCEVLRAAGDTVFHAAPEVWNRVCARQGSWYRESDRQGWHLLLSARRLPDAFEPYRVAEHHVSDFRPGALPSRSELQQLVQSPDYREGKPDGWERVKWWEGPFFKLFFTFTRAWRRGDHLRTRWLGQRANHANFLARRHVTRLDGEEVPYSVTENAGVCSSCVEFFALVRPGDRKLVRSCPGSIALAGAPADVYVDVRPVRRQPDPGPGGPG